MEKTFIRLIFVSAVAITGACGGSPSAGPDGSTVPAATSIVVSLSPLAVQVAPGGSVPLSASVTGTADTAVAWSVQEGAAGGSVTTSGVYVAPASVGTYHVVAAAHADPTKFQVATVSVLAAPAAGLSVLPGSTTLDACGSIPFRSTVGGTDSPAVAWSVKEGPAGGTVTPGGVYTAPPAAGTYHVVASSPAFPGQSAEAVVVVGPEKVLSVAVTPGSAAVTPNGAITLAAIVTTSCGSFAAQ